MPEEDSWVEKAEVMIAGLFTAAKRYLYTLVTISNPLTWTRLPFRLNRKTNQPSFVPPLVFLSVGSFLLARIVDFISVWFFDDPTGILMKLIQVEEISISSLVLKMLPLIVFAFIANRLLALILTRGERKQNQMFRFLCYTFGFYCATLFLLFLLNGSVLLMQKNPNSWLRKAPFETARLTIAGLGFVYVLLSPPCLAAIATWRLNHHCRWKSLKLVISILAAVLYLAVMVGALAVQSIRVSENGEGQTSAQPPEK